MSDDCENDNDMSSTAAVDGRRMPSASSDSVNSSKQDYSSLIALGDITKHNLRVAKTINQVIFPVTYTEQFYNELLKMGDNAKLALFQDVPVGTVSCRLESVDEGNRLYIMTLGCLASYRRLGIGSVLLQHVLSLCERDASIVSVMLHVLIDNRAALEFYKKYGFEVRGVEPNYYKRITPSDAYVLEKRIRDKPVEQQQSSAAKKQKRPH